MKSFVLLDCPLPDPLAGQSKPLSVCLSVCRYSLVFTGCQLFGSKPGIYEAKGEPRELLRFQCSSPVHLLPAFQILPVVVLYRLTGFQLYLMEAIGEVYLPHLPGSRKHLLSFKATGAYTQLRSRNPAQALSCPRRLRRSPVAATGGGAGAIAGGAGGLGYYSGSFLCPLAPPLVFSPGHTTFICNGLLLACLIL